MKINKIIGLIVFVLLTISIVIANIEPTENVVTDFNDFNITYSYQAHSAIFIDENADFGPTGYNFPGSGTITQPYLIENLHISEEYGDQIYIANTTAYFNISSCLLEDSSDGDGILLDNVINGYIYNNTLTNNTDGIKLYASPQNIVIDNKIYNNTYGGIRVFWSNDVVLEHNEVYRHNNSGILTYECYNISMIDNICFLNGYSAYLNPDVEAAHITTILTNATITDNFLYDSKSYGLMVINSGNTTISGNEIEDCGLDSGSGIFVFESVDIDIDDNTVGGCNDYIVRVESSSQCMISNNVIDDSLIDGIFINDSYEITVLDNDISYTSYSKTSYPDLTFASIYALDSDSLDIQFNDLTNNYDAGVYLERVTDSRIYYNDILSNEGHGLICNDSSGTTILGNLLSANDNGIVNTYSSGSEIVSNDIEFNRRHGIRIYESEDTNTANNEIYNNSLNGIDLTDSWDNNIQNNMIFWNNKSGVVLRGFDFPNPLTVQNEITENTIYENSHAQGIILAQTRNTLIGGNEVFGHDGSGIYCWKSAYLTVDDNTAYRNGILTVGDPDTISAGLTFDDCNEQIYVNYNNLSDSDDQGLIIYNSSDVEIYSNEISSNFNAGIYGFESTNCRITSNEITGNWHGLLLTNSTDCYIANNEFLENIKKGIFLNYSHSNDIISNQMDNNSHGVLLVLSDNNYLFSNDIHDSNGSGIFILNSYDFTIEENSIWNNGKAAMLDDEIDAAGITVLTGVGNIINNEIIENYDNGILFFDTLDSEIIDNVIDSNFGRGIVLELSDMNNIEYNLIHNNSQGIWMNGSSSNVIDGNTIYNTQGSGVVLVEESNFNLITQNEIYYTGLNDGWSGCLLIVDSIETEIIENLLRDSNEEGIILWHTNYTYIANNIMQDNGWNGIWAYQAFYSDITNNSFVSNGGYAIALNDTCYGNEITENVVTGNALGMDSQAQDNGSDNIFNYNYWDDWVSPDSDRDGYVDTPYNIDGTASNADPHPIADEIPDETTTTPETSDTSSTTIPTTEVTDEQSSSIETTDEQSSSEETSTEPADLVGTPGFEMFSILIPIMVIGINRKRK